MTDTADVAVGMGKPKLEWKDISLSVKSATGETRQILKSLSGRLMPGELTAVLGPSGAGKTTLLNLLAGRNTLEAGVVKLDGVPIDPVQNRDKMAYVMQQDALWPTSTVRESLEFAAKLRCIDNPKEKVDYLLEKLLLTKAQHTMNGNDRIRGTSGGEKKRTSIGVELVNDPELLLLDEPTSGLDSESATTVINMLKSLAVENKSAVLCTIHQPSSEIFQLFDSVIFLSGGSNINLSGHVIYQGPVKNIPGYLSGIDPKYELKLGYNMADHMMTLCHQDEAIEDLKGANARASMTLEPQRSGGSQVGSLKIVRKTNMFQQIGPLVVREWKNAYRDKAALGARFGACIFLGILNGCIFYQVADITADDYSIQSHFGAITMICIGAMFLNAQPVILSFPTQRPVFIREYASGLYGTMPYVIANTIMSFPLNYLTVVAQLCCTYFLMGLNGNWGTMSAILLLQAMAASSVGLFLGSLVSDVSKAMELAPIVLVPQILFAGFFVPMSQIPVWLRWVQYVCFLGYTIKLLTLNEFEWDDAVADKLEEIKIQYNYPDDIWQTINPVLNTDADENPWYVYVIILLALFFVFRVGCTLGLYIKGKQKFGT